MKILNCFLILLFLCAFSAKAQEQITTLNGQNYIGFIFDETNSIISLTDLNSVVITINKENISVRKKIFADIHTKSGKTYNATLAKISSNYFEFFDSKGSGLRIPKNDLYYIEIDGKQISSSSIKMLSSNSYRTNYPSVGVLIGTPGVFNLVFGLDFTNNFGLRLCGGGVSQLTSGGEINILYSLCKSRSFDSHLYLNAGLLQMENKEYALDYEYKDTKKWSYVGFGADINFRGLFLELGLSFGSGDYSSPQIMGGVGYVYRFND